MRLEGRRPNRGLMILAAKLGPRRLPPRHTFAPIPIRCGALRSRRLQIMVPALVSKTPSSGERIS
jgi:hypothetical protein